MIATGSHPVSKTCSIAVAHPIWNILKWSGFFLLAKAMVSRNEVIRRHFVAPRFLSQYCPNKFGSIKEHLPQTPGKPSLLWAWNQIYWLESIYVNTDLSRARWMVYETKSQEWTLENISVSERILQHNPPQNRRRWTIWGKREIYIYVPTNLSRAYGFCGLEARHT